ncbi:MAG: A24 family peptidase [Thermogutta sp.]
MFLMVKALPLLGVAAGITAGLAAITDLRQRRIPNVITVPAAVMGLVFHAFLPFGEGWLFALTGFAAGAALLLLPYLLGGGGMGDIKLLAALGSWLGPAWILVAFAAGIVVGAVLTLICLISGRSFEELVGIKADLIVPKKKSSEPRAMKALPLRNKKALPFAVPLAMGTWILLAALLLRIGL